MHNEVFMNCPKCNKICEAHISQVVLGFGEFNLDTGYNIEDLTLSEFEHLQQCLKDVEFWCCGNSFKPYLNNKFYPLNYVEHLSNVVADFSINRGDSISVFIERKTGRITLEKTIKEKDYERTRVS